MDFGSINPSVLIASLMVASVPIMLAALGELIVEKAGVLNLGVEGMMVMGAICGFIVTIQTESPFLGFVGGAMGGAALSLIFAFLTYLVYSNSISITQAWVAQERIGFHTGWWLVHVVMAALLVLLFWRRLAVHSLFRSFAR